MGMRRPPDESRRDRWRRWRRRRPTHAGLRHGGLSRAGRGLSARARRQAARWDWPSRWPPWAWAALGAPGRAWLAGGGGGAVARFTANTVPTAATAAHASRDIAWRRSRTRFRPLRAGSRPQPPFPGLVAPGHDPEGLAASATIPGASQPSATIPGASRLSATLTGTARPPTTLPGTTRPSITSSGTSSRRPAAGPGSSPGTGSGPGPGSSPGTGSGPPATVPAPRLAWCDWIARATGPGQNEAGGPAAASGTCGAMAAINSASPGRLAGSLARHAPARGRSGSGTPARSGWPCTIRSMIVAALPMPNGPLPVLANASREPRENTSLAGPTGSPLACSGDMNPGVPETSPLSVGWLSTTRDSPKSITRGPSTASRTFAGFRSRCTRPQACTAVSASTSPPASRHAAARGSGPCVRTRSSSEGPATKTVASQ